MNRRSREHQANAYAFALTARVLSPTVAKIETETRLLYAAELFDDHDSFPIVRFREFCAERIGLVECALAKLRRLLLRAYVRYIRSDRDVDGVAWLTGRPLTPTTGFYRRVWWRYWPRAVLHRLENRFIAWVERLPHDV